MQILNDHTRVVWDAHDQLNEWPLRQKENARVSLRSARSGNAGSDPVRQAPIPPVQMYAGVRLTGSQQVQTRAHGSDHSTMNVYQSQRKNAHNPFSSALADVFGIEEAYS